MTTPRQRLLDAFAFSNPDRIPVVYHPSPAGLHVHGRKLRQLFETYPPDNPVAFEEVSAPSVDALDENGNYHEVRKDEWGTKWEFLIFGLQGHPKSYPFADWQEAADYQFPALPSIDREEVARQRQDYLVFDGWVSIFEKLHALRPMDEVLMDLYTDEPGLVAFLDRLTDYWLEAIHEMIDAGVDVIMFADDWGTQTGSIISPDLFRRVFKPRYERLMAPVHAAGRKVFFHCCGFLDGVIDDLLDLGIDGLWPQIALFESDPSLFEKCVANQVAIYIHPDRQNLIPNGSPAEIDAEIRRYADKYSAGGGIFYVEIENDAPFENAEALIESIDKWR
jgi:hypothetical protein